MKNDRKFTSYALLGSGQIARHIQNYLRLLDLPVSYWSRNGDPAFNSHHDIDNDLRLEKTIADASHILIAVKDDAIAELGHKLIGHFKTLVHFSGALNLPHVAAAHPLMTFVGRLENREWYEAIPFVIDDGADFKSLLPGLHNPHYQIEPSKRPLYHALGSLAGNSTFLLWSKIGDEFEETLGLPREILESFLKQAATNALHNRGAHGLAGPVARGDWTTVGKHLESLERNERLLKAYRGYLNLAQESGAKIPEDLL
jgi:predicted short-subunit dehydrogenase-like oxidoreductase (DUF2520 family)